MEEPLILSVSTELCRADQLDLLFLGLSRSHHESLHGCMLEGELREQHCWDREGREVSGSHG